MIQSMLLSYTSKKNLFSYLSNIASTCRPLPFFGGGDCVGVAEDGESAHQNVHNYTIFSGGSHKFASSKIPAMISPKDMTIHRTL